MARVSIERAAFGDARYVLLGQELGITKWDALARCAAVWDYCQERGRKTLPSRMIDALHADLKDFSGAMIRAELARVEGPEIYIAGSNGRVEWLQNLRDQAPKGGAARQATLSDEEKTELGRRGAAARWGKEMPEPDIPAECQPSGSHDASAPALATVSGSNLPSPKKEPVSQVASSACAREDDADDDAAERTVREVLKVVSPNIASVTGRQVRGWIADARASGRDSWWICAALLDANGSMLKAKSAAYVTRMLANRQSEGWNCDDSRGFVEFSMRKRQRLQDSS